MKRFQRVYNLADLIQRIMEKWRIILLLAFVMAILMALYKTSELTTRQKEETIEDNNTYINLKEELEKIDETIIQKNYYLENTILSSLNPTEVACATITISVTTDAMKNNNIIYVGGNALAPTNEIATRDANRILNFYLRHFENGMEWGRLTEEFDTEPQFLNELISIASLQQALVTADLKAVYSDENGAKTIIGQVRSVLESYHEEAERIYGKHELLFTNELVETQLETKYNTWMNDRIVELNNLMQQKTNFENNMRGLSAPEIEVLDISKKQMTKEIMIYFVIGAVSGIILSAGLIGAWMLLSNIVLSGRELSNQFKLKKIADIPVDTAPKSKLPGFINKSDSNYDILNDQRIAWKIAGENIAYLAGNNSRIALISDLESEEIVKVKQSIEKALSNSTKKEKISLVSLPQIAIEPIAISDLEECDAVILVAQVLKSNYNRINDILDIINTYKKSVLGTIVMN